MEKARKQFIGSGMMFPIVIGEKGRPELSSELELIEASINHILSWPERHKYFNESFGSRLEQLLEEPNDGVVQTLIRWFVIEALEKWEKRIIVTDIHIEEKSQTQVNVTIQYNLKNTKIEESYIYPFYREIIY